ncbi:MAG: RNA-binding transcriptional accessory protein [Lachnospiraceae bacterium]|nr:RNA-binding transcriptional accessory protein [Lachnospiraceae bacterium]
MDIIKKISQELNIRPAQAEAAVGLIDEGNTIPFIARYRKEVTGSLNDEQLRALDERLKYLRNLEEKKAQAISSIEEQGKLTDELRAQIEAAETLVAVEDLYRPYRPKRRTRAMAAREKGLAPLAEIIRNEAAEKPLAEIAAAYLSDKEGLEVKTPEEAIAGACDIIAEEIADRADLRQVIRKTVFEHGYIESSLKDAAAETADEKKVYEGYYSYEEPVKKIPGHRVLALNRGEAEKILTVKVTAPDEQIVNALTCQYVKKDNKYTTPSLSAAVADSYKRLIFPAIERDIRSELSEKAEDGAIRVFGENLKQLLMVPPIAGHTVLGWDPAFRTGCKLCVVDSTGKVLYTNVIYPTPPQSRVSEAKQELKRIVEKYGVDLISLGNGTASRESEQVICEFIKESGLPVKYIIVNEAGASVYSASKLATEEFPQFDVGQRSAASMARRLQDPLSELVKIEPKAIGVGQYQHDCDQKKLDESLHSVVEDCVNKVGVDLNTASASLLQYVSGINRTLAGNIVSYREENGSFKSRKELAKVPKLGPKAFEQCAGFLRLRGGKEPLDMTGVHPESYAAAKELMKELSVSGEDIAKGGLKGISAKVTDKKAMAEKLGLGTETLTDILTELEKPGRDPREDMPLPVLKSDVLSMEDLKEGMELKGTVRNITDFGAFVDIGVHQDGLVHISRMTDKFIKHPLEVVHVGDVVNVKVLSVDTKKGRIALTMK